MNYPNNLILSPKADKQLSHFQKQTSNYRLIFIPSQLSILFLINQLFKTKPVNTSQNHFYKANLNNIFHRNIFSSLYLLFSSFFFEYQLRNSVHHFKLALLQDQQNIIPDN